MIVLLILKVSVLCAVIPPFFACCYFLFLAIARGCGLHAKRALSKTCRNHFAIVIPAYNEELVILETLKSCQELDYPSERYSLFVIADNCNDNTAAIAKSQGVSCWERHNMHQRGKGYALEWAFERLLKMPFDAFVVLDADCQIDSHALRVFDQCLEEGDGALQSNYGSSNSDESSLSYIAAVGNALEFALFYSPKSALELSVFLVGTGMVFSRSVLESIPWSEHSITEDAEYSVRLIRNNIRIRFIENVHVFQDAAVTWKQAIPQRKRWAGGTLCLARKNALRLLWQGLIHFRVQSIDAAWTLMILNRSLVLLAVIIAMLLSAVSYIFNPDNTTFFTFGLACASAVGILAYFVIGVLYVGITKRRLMLLLSTPGTLLRLIRITASQLLNSSEDQWIKTPRVMTAEVNREYSSSNQSMK